MFHLTVFSASQASSTSALTNIAPAADASIRTNGNFLYVPTIVPNFLGAYCWGHYVTQAQLQSPSLRQFALYDVAPIDQAVDPANPQAFAPRFLSPYALQPNEALQCLTTTTGATGGQANVAVWFSDGAVSETDGSIITVRFTATNGSATYTWNNVAITLSQNLPVGTYTCVGARVESANVDLFRFYPVGATVRPGGIAVSSLAIPDPYLQRYGRMGAWFTFDQLVLPTIDLFASTGSGSVVGYMDLIKNG
jgi:hypothetical protein